MNRKMVFFLLVLSGSLLTGCVEPRHTSAPVPQGSPQNVGACTCSSLINCSCAPTAAP